MKSTGIVRKVDELGRVVLPIELRRTLGIEEKDPLEIYMDGPSIVLRKYQVSCVFCDSFVPGEKCLPQMCRGPSAVEPVRPGVKTKTGSHPNG